MKLIALAVIPVLGYLAGGEAAPQTGRDLALHNAASAPAWLSTNPAASVSLYRTDADSV